jgi:hypothetical protein
VGGADVYCIRDCVFVGQVHLIKQSSFCDLLQHGDVNPSICGTFEFSNGILEKTALSANFQRRDYVKSAKGSKSISGTAGFNDSRCDSFDGPGP